MKKYNRKQGGIQVFAGTKVRADIPPPVTSEPPITVIRRMSKKSQLRLARNAERRRVLAKAYMEWLRENTELISSAVTPLAYAIADDHKYDGYVAVCESLSRSPISERMYLQLKITLHKTEVHAHV